MKKVTEIINKIEIHMNNTKPEIVSYGEVFTGIDLVEQMLNSLPNSFWENSNLKILDPCCGVGNFSSIIIKKLMIGLIEFEKDEKLRYKYIIDNMIFLCEIQPKNISSYLNFFEGGNYFEGSFLSEEFNKHQKNIWKIDKFDLIVGNPPYQIGKNTRSSVSIYHKFVEKSTEIAKIILMITPSKWYSNPSMIFFRKKMINDFGLKLLIDVNNAFPTVEIKGGVSYFLLENEYKGMCLYNGSYRKFKNDIITIEDNDLLITKLNEHEKFSKFLFSDQYFNIRNIDNRFLTNKEDGCVTCYVSSKNGYIKYIKEKELDLKPNHQMYKVFMPTASGTKNSIGELGRLIIGLPTEVCSRSFVHFAFNTKQECESFISYLNTDFVKKLISIKKQTQLVKKDCFSLVPIIPLDRIWDNFSVLEYFKIKI